MDHALPPQFFLYGEPPKAADPDFIHVEDLAARSQPSDWEIAPHHHVDLNHLILIAHGGGTIRYEMSHTAFAAPSLLIVPANVVHGFSWHEGSQGKVLTIARPQLDQLVSRHAALAKLFIEPGSVALVPAECRAIDSAMTDIARELSWVSLGQNAASEALLQLVLVQALRVLDRTAHGPHGGAGTASAVPLVARYRQLVEARYRQREPIARYARELAVSQTALREACAATGQSPIAIRDQRAMLEAQRLLAFSALSIAEIGEAIGIADPAYFSRFFARNCGVSPARWRRDLKARKQE